MIKICENKIKEQLTSGAASLSVLVFDTVESTNTLAKELAAKGVGEALVLARHQTGGRGRLGRSFFSPDGCGIYMSLLLRISGDVSLITSAAAVAVAEAIEKICAVRTDIKWINDVYIDGKKACGILCESVFGNSNKPEYTVVGIGINLISPDGFPKDIADIATSIFGKEIPDEDIPSRLISAIASKIFEYSRELEDKSFLKKYKKKSFVLGKKITVHSALESFEATAIDIDDDCHLIVKLDDGSTRTLSSGEISIRIK